MPWIHHDEQRSRAFNDWKAIDADIRSYIQLSEKWASVAYAQSLDDARNEFERRFDPDNDEPNEYFYDFLSRVGYLWEEDYFWMLRTGALRDAVTAFEVYAEKSAGEALGRWRGVDDVDGSVRRLTPVVRKGQNSPSWGTLCRIHEALGSNLETDNVTYIRELRHLLAHQRGELRTKELREQFMTETGPTRGGPFDPTDVPLTSLRLQQMLDDLASAVRACDGAIWPQTHTSEPPAALGALLDGKRAAITLGPK
ncbi:hypothetical protein [Mycolicibacterium aubagnense]|uniref:HEPN AbiU2-like domain-containing protein n=1 Tax=Mycolicibacterium aubagnense TaxID=319707 RepID=A0ABM7IJK1_9MYCO|nr:hypothetical protein [Mycolicibacterium aubagnense]TLH66175.1 hypothetical protein C1S80_07575 [Mycolicibacterium aubagnense]WGI31588.1 hypothetical protein QDT91_20490 [Mycolicibacterium aubagnense]BBX86959.1 hypothetical protein MAUB_48320 [Mycolicibacterium aubagnense]